MKWYLAEARFSEIINNKLAPAYKWLIHYATEDDAIGEIKRLIETPLHTNLGIVGDIRTTVTGPYESQEKALLQTENHNITFGEA